MRFAIFSDIHANLEAFEAVMSHMNKQGIDRYICLGDWVGYGPNPTACIEMGRDIPGLISLAGNHDWAVLNRFNYMSFNKIALEAIQWTQKRLNKDDRKFLDDLSLEYSEDDMLFVHASPHQPEEWKYVITSFDAKAGFEEMNRKGAKISFIGHTHYPGIFRDTGDKEEYKPDASEFSLDEKGQYIINVGSVGQPRDKNPNACYVSYDTTSRKLTFHRIPYPVNKVQEKILNSQLHPLSAVRLSKGY